MKIEDRIEISDNIFFIIEKRIRMRGRNIKDFDLYIYNNLIWQWYLNELRLKWHSNIIMIKII